MDRTRLPTSPRGNHRGGYSKASPGLKVVERDGHWHIHGTCRVGGRSIRVRRSTELPALPELREEADALRLRIEQEIRDEVIHGIKPDVALALAARDYLHRPREKPLSASDLGTIKRAVRQFGTQMLRQVSEEEWNKFVDHGMAGLKPATRERRINTVLGFLNWCAKRPRCWIDQVPAFDRNKAARNPNTRERRRVEDISTDLIVFLLEHAAPHLKAQLAVEWSTGGRVSSILHGCRLCDLVLAPGREQLTFHDTKNGEPAIPALHPYAVKCLNDYLAVRGRLHDREGALFLTHKKRPYASGRGTQNKSAFNGMKRRAIKTLRKEGARKIRELRADGAHQAAHEHLAWVKDRCTLIGKFTQHWFRHMLADNMLKAGADIRTVMAQGGWLDQKSVLGYTRDVPDYRRDKVRSLPIGDGQAGITGSKTRKV